MSIHDVANGQISLHGWGWPSGCVVMQMGQDTEHKLLCRGQPTEPQQGIPFGVLLVEHAGQVMLCSGLKSAPRCGGGGAFWQGLWCSSMSEAARDWPWATC